MQGREHTIVNIHSEHDQVVVHEQLSPKTNGSDYVPAKLRMPDQHLVATSQEVPFIQTGQNALPQHFTGYNTGGMTQEELPRNESI